MKEATFDHPLLREARTSVSQGWKNIVDDAALQLAHLPFSVRVLQVKQKFSELRCYTDHDHNPWVSNIISSAAAEARRTCESCGSRTAQAAMVGNWMARLCKKCSA